MHLRRLGPSQADPTEPTEDPDRCRGPHLPDPDPRSPARTRLFGGRLTGFPPMFDGKSTEGGPPSAGSRATGLVRDGELVTKGQGDGWISTDKTFDDFVLRLEYLVRPGGNSGVFIRSPRSGDPAYTGMEIQVLDDDDDQSRELWSHYRAPGSIYSIVAAQQRAAPRSSPRASGTRWRSTARGPKGQSSKLNGTIVVNANLARHADASQQHPGILRTEGYLGLQSHSDEVRFPQHRDQGVGVNSPHP